MASPRLPWLTTAQAAARLRIKPATLYAYVSRGLLHSQRVEDGGSVFDPMEIEALAAATRRSRSAATNPAAIAASGTPLMVLDSDLTLVDDGALLFRGVPAVDLARKHHYEQVATWFWNPAAGLEAAAAFNPPAGIESIQAAAATLGSGASLVDVLSMAVLAVGNSDPLRQDLSPEAVQSAGRRCIAAMVAALPDVGNPHRGTAETPSIIGEPKSSEAPQPPGGSLALQLGAKLSPDYRDEGIERLINSALILLLDHDMAASTMAARVAASARADPYAAIGSALGAFNGVLHGSASVAAAEMLTESMGAARPEHAISSQLAKGRGIPGFGHRIYRRQDPRAVELLRMMRPLPRFQPVLDAVDQVTAVVHSRVPHPANIDVALAALMIGARMHGEAGQVIFAVARTAGWLGHILDEYTRDPLRLRPIGRYTGPAAE